MDLKNFISESLYQIVGGINEAQGRIAELNAEVNSKQASDYHDVYFDIALTVVEEESNSSCSKLLVMGLSHLGSGSYDQMLSLVSRVKFSVPLSFVQSAKVKFPYLQFNTH